MLARELTCQVARLGWAGPSLLVQCAIMPDHWSTQGIQRLNLHNLRKQGGVEQSVPMILQELLEMGTNT